MKRVFLFLALMVPFFFCSCSEEDTSGEMSATVDSVSHSYKSCTFMKKNSKTYITSTEAEGSITIVLDTTILKTGKYVLGYFGSLTDVADISAYLTTILNPTNLAKKNAFIYNPSGKATTERFLSLFGVLTITAVSESNIEGDFTGMGMVQSVMPTLTAETFVGALKPFSGKFIARSWGQE